MTPELRTERLRLSPYVPADEEDFVTLFQDVSVGRWFGDGMSAEAEDRAVFRRIFSRVYAEDRFPVWAVRQDATYVGHAEIKPSPEPWLDGHEIVYGIGNRHQHQGLGTELAQALTSYGHGRLDLPSVHATVDAGNAASLALLKKIGYERVRDVREPEGRTTVWLTSAR